MFLLQKYDDDEDDEVLFGFVALTSGGQKD
jgi:hypothetical protein